MHAGQVVEVAPVRALFRHPAHPYTRALVRSIPRIDREIAMEPIPGAVPSLLNAPPGCRYAGRCPWVEERCRRSKPGMTAVAPEHFVACFAVEDGRAAACVRSTTSRSTSRCAARRRGCARCGTASRRWCAPSTACRSASRRARRWGWWANWAAASPRSRARWCGWCDPTGGHIRFDGDELTASSDEDFNKVRPHLQMVFQDPTASLNPRLSVRRMVEEPLQLHTRSAPPSAGSAPRRCSRKSGWAPSSPTAIRTNCRAGSASGSTSPARW